MWSSLNVPGGNVFLKTVKYAPSAAHCVWTKIKMEMHVHTHINTHTYIHIYI